MVGGFSSFPDPRLFDFSTTHSYKFIPGAKWVKERSEMGKKRPCCDKRGLKKGPWSTEEDQLLVSYVTKHGHGQWRALPKLAGLQRCGKSCRLRWTNYLRPDIIRGPFTDAEEKLIIQLHGILGNKWAAIASHLPGRTDNEIKNLWNTSLRKRLTCLGLDPQTHQPISTCYRPSTSSPPSARHIAQWESARLEAEARLSKESGTPVPPLDPFLRLWNSEVGETFRKIPTRALARCSLNNYDAISGTTTVNRRDLDANNAMGVDATGSVCSSSVTHPHQLDDLSDSAFQLLMDYPLNNDNGFFADHFIF